jgi:RNA polymerase sigma-70 factor (ECF subfamily)
MAEPEAPDITRLLRAWSAGSREALDELIPVVYDNLRKMALARMRDERREHTLQPTALINEAYLRLVALRRLQWEDRVHFFAMSSEIMRRVLVDHARSQAYLKRGGGIHLVTLAEPSDGKIVLDGEVLDLDNALKTLEQHDPRKAQITQLRFFAGFTVEEVADMLGISPETVHRDWKFAKAWIGRQLQNRSGRR